jgi:hypothetical protein
MIKKYKLVSLFFIALATGVAAQSDSLFLDYINDLPKETLSEQELNGIKYIREEEKLAHDVYIALYEKWNLNMFTNIAKSEQSHMDMVAAIIEKYNLEDPLIEEIGVFADSLLQKLYGDLLEHGLASLENALYVGCTIEDVDIFDLEELLVDADNIDLRTVYQNLTKGSRNHMRSFERQYSAQAGTYTAQYITSDLLNEILTSGPEQGFVDSNGDILVLTGVASSKEIEMLPNNYLFATNYPNPFNPQTTIEFSISSTNLISVAIFDITGKHVKTLMNHESVSAGNHVLIWDGLDESGNISASGSYFYRINSETAQVIKQMTLLR